MYAHPTHTRTCTLHAYTHAHTSQVQRTSLTSRGVGSHGPSPTPCMRRPTRCTHAPTRANARTNTHGARARTNAHPTSRRRFVHARVDVSACSAHSARGRSCSVQCLPAKRTNSSSSCHICRLTGPHLRRNLPHLPRPTTAVASCAAIPLDGVRLRLPAPADHLLRQVGYVPSEDARDRKVCTAS